MSAPRFDLTPFLDQYEGQHYDRKSLFEVLEGAKRARSRRNVRDQVARYVAAFAKAEGGVLVLGIEDDGRVTGARAVDRCRRGDPRYPRGPLGAATGARIRPGSRWRAGPRLRRDGERRPCQSDR